MYTVTASDLTGGAQRVTFQGAEDIIEMDLPVDHEVTLTYSYDVCFTTTEPVVTNNTVIVMHGIIYQITNVTLISCGGLLARTSQKLGYLGDGVYITINSL